MSVALPRQAPPLGYYSPLGWQHLGSPVTCRPPPSLARTQGLGTPFMSYFDPPPTPSPEPPKSPYEFDAAKWEHQQMAENGGVERMSYQPSRVSLVLMFFQSLCRECRLLVSVFIIDVASRSERS